MLTKRSSRDYVDAHTVEKFPIWENDLLPTTCPGSESGLTELPANVNRLLFLSSHVPVAMSLAAVPNCLTRFCHLSYTEQFDENCSDFQKIGLDKRPRRQISEKSKNGLTAMLVGTIRHTC